MFSRKFGGTRKFWKKHVIQEKWDIGKFWSQQGLHKSSLWAPFWSGEVGAKLGSSGIKLILFEAPNGVKLVYLVDLCPHLCVQTPTITDRSPIRSHMEPNITEHHLRFEVPESLVELYSMGWRAL